MSIIYSQACLLVKKATGDVPLDGVAFTTGLTIMGLNTGRLVLKKTVLSAWASTLNMGLIKKG